LFHQQLLEFLILIIRFQPVEVRFITVNTTFYSSKKKQKKVFIHSYLLS